MTARLIRRRRADELAARWRRQNDELEQRLTLLRRLDAEVRRG